MRRYFITGGTGFVGRAVVRKLLEREDTEQIVCLTRMLRTGMMVHKKIQYLIGDVIDFNYPHGDYTDLIHAAAEANDLLVPDKPQYYMTVVEGARRVFEWAATQQFQRILFVSSGGVVKGDSPYCRAKRMSEWLAERYDINAKIARVYSLVGDEMPLNGQYALGRFIWQAVHDVEIRYYGGDSVRSYLHIDDCADWLLAILDGGQPKFPLDVGSVNPITVRSLANLVGIIAKVPVRQDDSLDDHRMSNTYVPAPVFGHRETIDLKDSIRSVLLHAKTNIRHTDK